MIKSYSDPTITLWLKKKILPIVFFLPSSHSLYLVAIDFVWGQIKVAAVGIGMLRYCGAMLGNEFFT